MDQKKYSDTVIINFWEMMKKIRYKIKNPELYDKR